MAAAVATVDECPVHNNLLQALLHLQSQSCNGYAAAHHQQLRPHHRRPPSATAAAVAGPFSAQCTCSLHKILIKVVCSPGAIVFVRIIITHLWLRTYTRLNAKISDAPPQPSDAFMLAASPVGGNAIWHRLRVVVGTHSPPVAIRRVASLAYDDTVGFMHHVIRYTAQCNYFVV